MWYGKNDNKWDEEIYIAAPTEPHNCLENLKHSLEIAKLKADLEDHFNNLEYEDDLP